MLRNLQLIRHTGLGLLVSYFPLEKQKVSWKDFFWKDGFYQNLNSLTAVNNEQRYNASSRGGVIGRVIGWRGNRILNPWKGILVHCVLSEITLEQIPPLLPFDRRE